MKEQNYQIARDYFTAVTNGDLPDAMLTEDTTGWITTTGTMDKAAYQRLVRMLGKMCASPLTFTINALTADEDRVVAEAVSHAVLVNGETYSNTYVFIFRIREGRIAAVAEHYNAITARDKLVPLMAEAARNL
jgi:ketosteroid isomerase-like protein